LSHNVTRSCYFGLTMPLNASKMLQYAATCLAFTKVSFRWIVFSERNSHHHNYRRTLMRHKLCYGMNIFDYFLLLNFVNCHSNGAK